MGWVGIYTREENKSTCGRTPHDVEDGFGVEGEVGEGYEALILVE
jgi:hypothetical protein